MTIFEKALSLCVMSLFVLSHQGCSNGSYHGKGIEAPRVSMGAIISGRSVKGVIGGADCVALSSDRVTELYSSVGSPAPCTNSQGSYSFQLFENRSGPVIVEIRGRAGTTTTCDLPVGCDGGVAFGASVPLDTTFNLRSIVPEIDSTATTQEVNISPWSEVAAARALALDTTGNLDISNVQTANAEVASVLNNMFGLEGNNDAFTEDFFTIDLVNLADPSADNIDSSQANLSVLMSMASASLFNLVGTDSNTNIQNVVSNLTAAFENDGEFNVNDTAVNIQDDGGIDLSDLLGSISSVVENISSVLDTNSTASISTLLGSTTTLTSLNNQIKTLRGLKSKVTDANNDTTKPIKPVDPNATDVDKAKALIVDLANIVEASRTLFEPIEIEGATDVFDNIESVMTLTNDDVMNASEGLIGLIESAGRMIFSQDSASELVSAGCTDDSSTLTCSLSALSQIVTKNSMQMLLGAGSGTLSLNKSTDVVTATNATIGTDVFTLVLTGGGATASPSYTLTSALVNIGGSSSNYVSFGSTSTASMTISNDTPQTFTLDANMVKIFTSGYSFTGDLALVRDITRAPRNVVTNFDFDGDLMLTEDSSVFSVSITFMTDTSTITSAPFFDDEADDNFYTINDVRVRFQAPITYEKSAFNTAGERSSSATTETLVIELGADRTTNTGATVEYVRLRALSSTASAFVGGTLSEDATSGVTTFTFRTSDGRGVLVMTDTGTQVTGTMSVGASAGVATISTTGTVTFNDNTSISLPALVLHPNL